MNLILRKKLPALLFCFALFSAGLHAAPVQENYPFSLPPSADKVEFCTLMPLPWASVVISILPPGADKCALWIVMLAPCTRIPSAAVAGAIAEDCREKADEWIGGADFCGNSHQMTIMSGGL